MPSLHYNAGEIRIANQAVLETFSLLRRFTMKRHLTSLILTAALSAIAGSSSTASAQSSTAIANIPFAFQVQNVSFAAGTYSVSRNVSNGVITLRAPDYARMFATYPSEVSTAKEPKLTFTCYGANCELSKASLPDGLECGLPKSSNVEKPAHKLGMAAEVRSIRLATR
jgi:hypothetical protein